MTPGDRSAANDTAARMTSRGMAVFAVTTLLLLARTSYAAAISTAEIVAQTTAASFSCMRWLVVGLCFWLDCDVTGCRVQTSLKVGHYNPDLVISVYNELGGNPWSEIGAMLGAAQRSAANGLLGSLTGVPIDSAGNRSEGSREHRDHKNLLFRETDAIGHPAAVLSDVVASSGLLCASEATPFTPYFASSLDALAWRQEIPEIFYPASWIPGLREIGTWPLQTWGSVHPRTGWTTQAEEPKAAAINAQRAADIVTRGGQPHIYRALADGVASVDQQVWSPGPLVEGDAATGTWQMLAPLPESNCAVFGSNDLASATGWGGGRVDAAGDYVWNLWRPYQCCSRRGQMFLLDLNWIVYPP